MTLLLGSHGPTMNVCIAKFTDCPWPIIHCCSPRVRCQTTAQTNGPSDPSQHGPVTLTTHKISVPENCYTQTHWTQEKYTAYAHTPTHTHLISSCVHHSKPRGPRSTPLSCAYCTRQCFSDDLGVTAWAKEQSCWIWPTRGCVILTIQSIGTVCFVALRLLELFSKNAQGIFFFFAKLWEIIWSLFFVFLIQSYKSTEILLNYSTIFSKTNPLCYFIQPMQLCGKAKPNLQCMNGWNS